MTETSVWEGAQWPCAPVGSMAVLENGYPFDSRDFEPEGDVPLVRIRDLTADEFETYIKVRPPQRVILADGDLVVGMDGDFNVVRWTRGPAALNQRLCLLRGRPESDLRFVQYALPRNLQYINATQYATTVKHLSSAEVLGARIPRPPLEVQRRIADFLDDQTTRINNIITARKAQLDLIGAQFDAVVRDAVSGRGSSSRLGWTKQQGATRTLMPLGRLLRIRGEKNDPVTVTQVLSLTAARGIILYEEKGDIGNKASEDISRYSIVRPNDIVLNSMNVIIGSVGLSRYTGVLSPVYYVLCPISPGGVDMRFLAYHFRIREFQQQLVRLGYGILDHRLRIPWINLKAELLTVPPLPEQVEIADDLDRADYAREMTLGLVSESIERLEEMKRCLISAAVSGEFDVSTADGSQVVA